jgi:acetyltransferase
MSRSRGDQLRRLLYPHSIAVVGASTSSEKAGSQLLHALRSFPGPLYPINPKATEIQGFKTYPNLASLPQAPDLVALAVPASVAPEVMREASAAEAGGALIIGGGFAEVGAEGAHLEAEVIREALAGGMRVLGPNTSGFVNPSRACFATFAPGTETVTSGPVAVVAQSGGVNLTVAFLLARAGVGVSIAVGLGNAADVGAADLLQTLADDTTTRVIALHLEGIADGRRLYETLRAVTPRKPVVVLTVGRSDSADFAKSHTGALLGEYELKIAALRQAGAIVVGNTDALVDACAALSVSRLSPHPAAGVALLTAQAGPGLLIVDNLRAEGVRMPALSNTTLDSIRQLLPPLTYMKNPVDTGRPSPHFAAVLDAVIRDSNIDLVCISALNEPEVLDVPNVLGNAARATPKPLLYCGMGALGAFEAVLTATRAQGVPSYGAPERLVGAARAMVDDASSQWHLAASMPAAQTPPSVMRPAGSFDEVGAKAFLELWGLACPTRRVCANRADARAAFAAHGGPMVVKVIDRTILHKTDVGGVHVNVCSLADLERALDRIDSIPGSPRPYLLEVMAPPGLELIVGAVRDRTFGPVVLVGLGGTLAEALHDVSRRVAPIDALEAERMLSELQGHALLDGWRGTPAVSRRAITHALLAVSNILVGYDTITEVEINPLRVYPDGALVLDALII